MKSTYRLDAQTNFLVLYHAFQQILSGHFLPIRATRCDIVCHDHGIAHEIVVIVGNPQVERLKGNVCLNVSHQTWFFCSVKHIALAQLARFFPPLPGNPEQMAASAVKFVLAGRDFDCLGRWASGPL